jgi:hypothetical protein
MARQFLLLLLGLLLVGVSIAAALDTSRRRLRGGAGRDEAWEGTYDDDDIDDDSEVAAFFAAAEDMDGQEPLTSTTPTAALADAPPPPPLTSAATLQQGPVQAPPTLDRWISYGTKPDDRTYYFTGDAKPIWESVDGEIRFNGHPFHVKGINWFGFETDTRVLHGLDVHDADFYLDMLRENGFNLLRIPISLAAALDLDSRPLYHYFVDPNFRGKTVGELLQVRVVFCEELTTPTHTHTN